MATVGDRSGLAGDPKGVAAMPKATNPQVYLDISIGKQRPQRISFELFADQVPKTSENFRALCTGECGLGASTQKPLHFKGTQFHRIVKGFGAQGGDFSRGDGRGGESIYGGQFPDEHVWLLHDKPGLLSMANSGAHANGSQFFITFRAAPLLDRKHIVFGRVLSGGDFLKKLDAVGAEDGKPSCRVTIVDCGQLPNTGPWDQQQGVKGRGAGYPNRRKSRSRSRSHDRDRRDRGHDRRDRGHLESTSSDAAPAKKRRYRRHSHVSRSSSRD